MLKDEFLREMEKYDDYPVAGRKIVTLENAWSEGSYEYFCKEFLNEYWHDESFIPRGTKGNIFVPLCIWSMPKKLFRMDYSKTGGAAIMQYSSPNGKIKHVYYTYKTKTGWSSSLFTNPSTSRLWDKIPHLVSMGTEYLVHNGNALMMDIKITDNIVSTPKEGFHININSAVEFNLVEAHAKMVKAHIKHVTNGGVKYNQIVEVTVENGDIRISTTDVEEDWWGLHIPDFKIPFFNCPTPFNKSIHEYLLRPIYAGENFWVISWDYNEYPFVKMNDKWFPMADLSRWDIEPFVTKEVMEEYRLYKLLK